MNYITGRVAMPALPSVWMALYTTAPTGDNGLGGTEVVGGAYARQQVAGSVPTSATSASGTSALHFVNIPAWIIAQMVVNDTTDAGAITNMTISSVITGAPGTITLTGTTSAAVTSGANIVISAFSPASGSTGAEPTTTPGLITNNAAVTFPAATGNWGTVTSYGLYDASGAGNLLQWDYLGNYSWLPCTISSASAAVFTATANGYTTGLSGVYTTKYGGQAPTVTQGTLTGILGITSTGADTFTVATTANINTSSTGDGQFRAVGSQSVPSGVTASFAAGSIVVTTA